MDSVFQVMMDTNFWFTVIKLSTPVIFAALGAYYASRVGLFNIGLEGIMLMGAFLGMLASGFFVKFGINTTIGLILSFIVICVVGAFSGFFIGFFHLKLDADIGITGLVYNLFASGLTVFLLVVVLNDKGASFGFPSLTFPFIELPLISMIPVLGEIISGQNFLTYLAFIFVGVTTFVIRKTTFGMRMIATGENDHAVESVGISSTKYKLIAFTISGILAALGGSFLSMAFVPYFIAGMTSGRGFIGLTANLVGVTPIGGMLISFLFGFADTLGITMQIWSTIPTQFIAMLPFVFTLVALVIYSYIRKRKSEY